MRRSQWKIRTNLDSSKRADYSEVCSICCQTSTLLGSCDAKMSASGANDRSSGEVENVGDVEGRRRDSGNLESSIAGLTTTAAATVATTTTPLRSLRESSLATNVKSNVTSVANPKAAGLSMASTVAPSTTSDECEGEAKALNECECARSIRLDPCKDPLISACLCLGRRQHKSCIESWLEQSGATSCPLCQVKYEFKRERKSLWLYMKENELEHELVVSLASLGLAGYLFLLGLAVCGQHMVENEQTNDSVLSSVLFCLVCVSTVLLFIGTVSIGLNVAFRHYVRYSLWCKSHYRVHIEPYRLAGHMT